MKKTPLPIIEKFEKAIEGLDYGAASITCYVLAGKLRFVIERKESILEKDVALDGENAAQDTL